MIERTMAEYRDPDQLSAAIRALRARGYRRLRAYTPIPIPDVEDALALPRSRLPIGVFVTGVLGAASAYFLQWLVNAYLYPLDVGGRPAHFPLAFVPITFEMGVLSAALAAVLGVFLLGQLLALWHPVFEADGFESATEDGYWLEVSSRDALYDAHAIERELIESGAAKVVRVGGAP